MNKAQNLVRRIFSSVIVPLSRSHLFFVYFFGLFLLFSLLPYYRNGGLILGGEGDFVLDFFVHLKKFSFMWFPTYGVGIPNLAPSGTGLNIFLLCAIEKITGSETLANLALIFAIYFLPFIGMYLVAKELKTSPPICFASSLFYVVNPFMSYHLICINQWNVFSIAAMPMFLWVILRYYRRDFMLFFVFGVVSFCFAPAFTNAPMFVVVQLSVLPSCVFVSYYYHKRLKFGEIARKYALIMISFVLSNLWWLLGLFVGVSISSARRVYPFKFAREWLDITVSGHGAVVPKTFLLSTILPGISKCNFFSNWYCPFYAKFIMLIPILLIVYYTFFSKDKKSVNLLNHWVFAFLLFAFFFAKGNAGIFGFVFTFLFDHFPFFYLFKSPIEKFGLFYIFVFTFMILLILKGIHGQKFSKIALSVFSFYLLFCSMPFLAGHMIPDFDVGAYGIATRQYRERPHYRALRNVINADNRQYRIFSLPGEGNYQVCLFSEGDKKYIGMNPLLMNLDKSYIAPEHQANRLYKHISEPNYKKMLALYNIKKIVLNEDLLPWFGLNEDETAQEINNIFAQYCSKEAYGNVTVFDTGDYYIPLIYSKNSD